MDTLTKIFKLLEENGIDQIELANYLGVKKQTITNWKSGASSSYSKFIDKIAEFLNVSTDYLLGKTDIKKSPEQVVDDFFKKYGIPYDNRVATFPVLGSVSAGNGCLIEENIIGYEAADIKYAQDGETYYWLEVKGDSMTPKIEDGDLVLVRQQRSVDSGSYAVVAVNGDEGVVKKIKYGEDWIELHSINPYYPVRRFEGADVLNIYVCGLVIESKRKF